MRQVAIPVDHPDFCFDSDEVSHGARLWTNVLSLMSAHAWLEQQNRKVVKLTSGERVIMAEAEDYEAAYDLFVATCERSVVNLSDTHRRILDAVYGLQGEEQEENTAYNYFGAGEDDDFVPRRKPVSQRKFAERSGVPQSTISDNKSFLVQSLKLLVEGSRGGLGLVKDAEPSWWEKTDALDGFPKPDQVRRWWAEAAAPEETLVQSGDLEDQHPEVQEE